MAANETMRRERRDEARRVLEGYRALCAMHDNMLALMEDADSRLLSTTAQMSETRASGSAGDSIGSGLAKLETAARRLESADDRICATLDATLALVERVIEERPIAGRVLSMRYLSPAGDEPTFEQIADRMGYSEEHIKHVHLVGLDIAADLLKENTF